MAYIKGVAKRRNNQCFICEAVKNYKDPSSLVLFLDEHIIVLLNKYPYNSGHLMIAPKRHTKNIEDMNEKEWSALFHAFILSKRILDRVYEPEGYNIGINLGKAAGAGLEDHLHFHVVPRWSGDASFMTVIASTKVIPQSLEDSLRELKKALEDLSKT